jgi:hypothetical protein
MGIVNLELATGKEPEGKREKNSLWGSFLSKGHNKTILFKWIPLLSDSTM